MPERFIYLWGLLVWGADVLMTAATIALAFWGSELVYFIALVIMLVFWIGRLKREIDTFHDGNPIKFFRSWFNRKKKG